ncbi:MAG: hydrogenase maturation protease [Bacteroidota bacterium]|nr:hydrogenase maturation protease [Bacteroidota bacterium]
MNSQDKILVVGAGNILLADEGFGIIALSELRKKITSDDVVMFDAGTDIYKIMNLDDRFQKIIVLDAVKQKQQAGTIYRLPLHKIEIESDAKSSHQIKVIEALKLMQVTIDNLKDCEIIIMGVEPAKIEYCVGLSKEVERALVYFVDLVLEEIENARSIVSQEYN